MPIYLIAVHDNTSNVAKTSSPFLQQQLVLSMREKS